MLSLDLGYKVATTRPYSTWTMYLHHITHAILVLAARDFACCRSFK